MARGSFVVPEFVLEDPKFVLYLISMHIAFLHKDSIIPENIDFRDKVYTTEKPKVFVHSSVIKTVTYFVEKGTSFRMPNIIYKYDD